MEHAVLVLGRQPRVQRQYFGMAVLALLKRLVGVADLALAGQEDQRVADALVALDFIAGSDDAVKQRALPAACGGNGVRDNFLAGTASGFRRTGNCP